MLNSLNKVQKQFLLYCVVASLAVSLISSFITYKIIERKIPEVAVVDMAYLYNDFAIKISRYLSDKNLSEDKITKAVLTYNSSLESVLKKISKNGNYILLQKQTVVSEGVNDVTKDLEELLYEGVVSQVKQGGKDAKDNN